MALAGCTRKGEPNATDHKVGPDPNGSGPSFFWRWGGREPRVCRVGLGRPSSDVLPVRLRPRSRRPPCSRAAHALLMVSALGVSTAASVADGLLFTRPPPSHLREQRAARRRRRREVGGGWREIKKSAPSRSPPSHTYRPPNRKLRLAGNREDRVADIREKGESRHRPAPTGALPTLPPSLTPLSAGRARSAWMQGARSLRERTRTPVRGSERSKRNAAGARLSPSPY